MYESVSTVQCTYYYYYYWRSSIRIRTVCPPTSISPLAKYTANYKGEKRALILRETDKRIDLVESRELIWHLLKERLYAECVGEERRDFEPSTERDWFRRVRLAVTGRSVRPQIAVLYSRRTCQAAAARDAVYTNDGAGVLYIHRQRSTYSFPSNRGERRNICISVRHHQHTRLRCCCR